MFPVVALSLAVLGLLMLAFVALAWLQEDSKGSAQLESRRHKRVGASKEKEDGTDVGKHHWLVGESENVAGKKYLIGERTATVGRKPANHIQLTETNISRVHCRFHGSPGRCKIEDLESSHGTYVNDDELDPETPIPLRDGDSVHIGETEFTYRRSASFGTDDALTERKQVGDEAVRETAAPGEIGVDTDLLSAVKETGGDIEEAAEQLGMEPEEVQEKMFGELEDE